MTQTLTLDIVVEDAEWEVALPDFSSLADSAGRAVITHLGLTGPYGATVLACDDGRISTLNQDFRGKPQPTNVLSWPSADRAPDTPGARPAAPAPDPFEPVTDLGDMALALGVCRAEAADQGKPLAHHVTHLIVHGLLHVLGYDHINDADAALMEAEETAILATLGVPDPY